MSALAFIALFKMSVPATTHEMSDAEEELLATHYHQANTYVQ